MSQESSSSSGKRWHAASWQPLWFLNAHDFAVRDIPKGALYGLTLVYVVGYLAILLLGWLS
jgi:hypothetical protein